MSPNEKYVLEALKSEYGGEFYDGEDPPDAYLILNDRRIAVEVTMLVEQVPNKSYERNSRMTQDAPALRLVDKIDKAMRDLIPDDKYVVLTVGAPVNNIRSTEEMIIAAILNKIAENSSECEFIIENNRISINIYDGYKPSGKKVIGVVSNRYSDANIDENVMCLLEDRITTKAKKCNLKLDMDEYWLALYNTYWVAEPEDFRAAYNKIDIDHNFKKIFIVNDHGEMYLL